MTLESLRLALADIVTVTRRAFVDFGNHECAQRSAALAYYALFSMFPLLLLTISLLGFMLEAGVPMAVDGQAVVLRAVEQTLPQAKDLVEQIIVNTRRARGGTGLIGLIVLAWSASNIFTHARLAMNAIWDTGLPQGLGGVVRLRLNALGMAIATGLLLFVSTLSDTILQLIARYVNRLPWSATLWFFGRPLLLASTTVALFALLYRFLPRATLSWADVWPGAIVGGVGWEVLKRAFVWYTTSAADWTAIYGPITGVIGLLLWLYLSAQVLLFGAEFAAAYAHMLEEKHAPVPVLSESEIMALVQVPLGEFEEALPRASGGDGVSPVPAGTLPCPEETRGTLHRPEEPEVAPPRQERRGTDLARGTAVGLVGAGVAGGLAIVGLLATGRRLLTRRSASAARDRAE
jgi:membrane protein